MKIKVLLAIALFIGINTLKAQAPVNSLDFDGTNDYVSATLPTVFNDIPNNDFTMETWIKPNGNTFSRVIFAQLNSSNFASISLSSTNQVYFYVNNVTGMNTTTTLPIGVWSHVACTWDASTQLVEIYINGVLETISSGGSSSLGTDNLMTVGAKTNGTQLLTGELDELRIWDVIRTQCQISGAMNSEFTITQPNLIAYYNFNEGTAGGTNTGISTLPDFTTNYDGTLLNFGLTGANSNWLASGAVITAVNQSSGFNTTDVQSACESYLWQDGNTYTSNNNSATWNLLSDGGCDSIITLDLTINTSYNTTDIQSACDSYLWIDGNTYTTNNNSASILLTSISGCDSIVTLDLTINTVNNSVTQNGFTISADETGATYQWLDCDNAFEIITGETNQDFTASSDGNYAVEVTVNGCTDTSACLSVSGIGINDNNIEDRISIYPNPANNKIHINGIQSGTINIYDLSGRMIISKSFQASIDVSMLDPGMYIIAIEDLTGTLIKTQKQEIR